MKATVSLRVVPDQDTDTVARTLVDHLELNSRQMWNCINRYVRRGFGADDGDRKGVTLFMSHANGFPKEVCTKML